MSSSSQVNYNNIILIFLDFKKHFTIKLFFIGGSTFGFVAAMRKLELGYFVNGKGTMNACKRIQLSHAGTTGNNEYEGANVFR